MKLKTIKAAGKDVDIHVKQDGRFVAHVEDEYCCAETLKELDDQIRKVARRLKVKIAVPVTLVGVSVSNGKSGFYYKSVTHDSLDVMLVGTSSGRRARFQYRDEETGLVVKVNRFAMREQDSVWRRVAQSEVHQYRRLIRLKEAAERALEKFIDARKIDASEAIRVAVAAAVKERESEDEIAESLESDPRTAGAKV